MRPTAIFLLLVCTVAASETIRIDLRDGIDIRYGDTAIQKQPADPRSVHGVYVIAIRDGAIIANEQFNTAAHRAHGEFFERVATRLPVGAEFVIAMQGDVARHWDDHADNAYRKLTGRAYESGSVWVYGIVGDADGVHVSDSRVGSIESVSKGPIAFPSPPAPRGIPEGYSKRHFEFAGYNLARPILLHFYRPANLAESSAIVFMMHGQTRQGDSEMKHLYKMADRHGALIIAPEYEGEHHPTSHHYERGGTRILAERYWPFAAIEHIFDYAKACTRNTSDTYMIMGHSAGGYYTHRFAIYMPDARYRVAIAHNSGSYALPDLDEPFATQDRLRESLQRNAYIMIGDYRLSTEPKEGKTGLRKRGEAAIVAHRALAEELGVACAWKLRFVPGVAHVPGPMFLAAEPILFP